MVLMVAMIALDFASIFCFICSLLIDRKIELGIFMIDRPFYQQYHFTNACLQGRSETRNVFAGLSCSYRQWRHFYCFFIRLFGAIANKSQKESIFGFMMVCK